jgi:hypothetical protein
MKADYDSRANAIAITLVEVESSTAPAQEDRVHDRAGVALVDGHPVHIEILYPDHGIDEPLAAVAARYPLDVESLRAAARSALEAPDRVVTLDVAARD